MSAAICNDRNIYIYIYEHEAIRIPKSENNIGAPSAPPQKMRQWTFKRTRRSFVKLKRDTELMSLSFSNFEGIDVSILYMKESGTSGNTWARNVIISS